MIDHAAGLAGGEVAMARLLNAADPSRFEVRVLLLAKGPLVGRLRSQGIRTAVLPVSERLTNVGRADAATPLAAALGALRTLAMLPRLVAAIRGSGAELVVANSLKSAVLTALAAPLARRPWVWHLHDRIAPDYLPGPVVTALRALARRAPRGVVANSAATRSTVAAVPARRATVAYPGLDVVAAPLAPRREDGLSFGLLGRIAPTKGQLEFLRAAALLAPRHPDARFAVIGDAMFNDAAFGEEVRALPARLGIAELVAFPGWVAEPLSAIAGLTALVHASPVPEPFGQVLVEAMLAGIPVIATRAGGVPEIVDPEGVAEPVAAGVLRSPFGLLVEPGDVPALAAAMSWVAEHREEAAEAAARARSSVVERFDIRASARAVEGAWARALGA